MRFLLTGATGYLGSHLRQELCCAGHEVVVGVRTTCPRAARNAYDDQSIDLGSEELGSELAGRDIDAIIHTATSYGRKGESISDINDANVKLPLRLLDTATAVGIQTFVNADTVLPPEINAYARSKAQLRNWAKEFAHCRQHRFINFKIDHMYGPGEDLSKFVTHIVRSCLAQNEPIELTEGRQRRDFIHIRDVVSAYMAVLNVHKTLPLDFIEFEVGSGSSTEIRRLVQAIHELTDSSAELHFGAVAYRPYEVMNSQLDSAALRALGWSPRICLVEGLKELIAFERENRLCVS